MNSFENPEANAPEGEAERPLALTREDVQARLSRGENLEGLRLADVDLAGLPLEGKSFQNSDIRGVRLYRRIEDKGG